MDEVIVRTRIRVPPSEAFAFLTDFPGYAKYSEYLKEVRADGDGGPGTAYELDVAWWKLSYTAHTEVVDVEEPARIRWRVTEAVDAHGAWEIEPVDDGTDSEVTLRIFFDADSADRSAVNLPRFVSIGWVIDRVKPLVVREAEDVVERIVADLEGEPRPVDLTIETRRS